MSGIRTRTTHDIVARVSDLRATISRMPAKDPERRRATVRAWYARTKYKRTAEESARQTSVKRVLLKKNAAWLAEYKERLSCQRCGESHPACLQFHHKDPAVKEITVTDAIRRGWSRKRVLDEIEKCEVLCANCHAKHHAAERVA